MSMIDSEDAAIAAPSPGDPAAASRPSRLVEVRTRPPPTQASAESDELLVDGVVVEFALGGRIVPTDPGLEYCGAVVSAQPELADAELTNTAAIDSAVVLAHRGGCTFLEKAERAAAAGAVALIIINSDNKLGHPGGVEASPIPVLLVRQSDGEELHSATELLLRLIPVTLHEALRRRLAQRSQVLLAMMVELATPELCSQTGEVKDRVGNKSESLPMHIALDDKTTPVELTLAIIAAHPAAAAIKYKDFRGIETDLPLLRAVQKAAPSRLLNALEAVHPLPRWWLGDAVPLASGSPALLAKVLALVTSEACAQTGKFKDFRGREEEKLPLHIALGDKDTPSELTLAILAAHPDAHKVRCANGFQNELLPFELAVSNDQPSMVLAALVDLESEGINGATCVERKNRGVTFRNLLLGSKQELHRRFAQTYGCELATYKHDDGPPIHLSRSALARYATDTVVGRPVCLKYMKDLRQFEAEVTRRFTRCGRRLPPGTIIEVLSWHMPAGEALSDACGKSQAAEPTAHGAEYPYVLVMERGERSLHDACQKERLAGYNVVAILDCLRCILRCVGAMHAEGIVHADIKQRNILRRASLKERRIWLDKAEVERKKRAWQESHAEFMRRDKKTRFKLLVEGVLVTCSESTDIVPAGTVGEIIEVNDGNSGRWVRFPGVRRPVLCLPEHLAVANQTIELLEKEPPQKQLVSNLDALAWIMCDMDGAAFVGEAVGIKTSSGYAPPELARHKYGRTGGAAGQLDAAEPSFDCWSLGVVIFELCTGRTLFSQDTSNDELIEEADKVRLCTWHVITDDELSPVFKETEGVSDQTIADAKNLIRWCLQGDSRNRPTVVQILSHRFLNPASAVEPLPQPMRYHAFLSHAQADASGTVATLYHEYKKLGLHCWLDMKQTSLTLEGMRQGVRDSDVFVLILSQRVLGSWFCQQEILCAIEAGKHVQLVVEEEPRFFPFDRAAWTASKGQSTRQITPEMQLKVSKDSTVPWQQSLGNDALAERISQLIDTQLSNAVTYRRRDFEQAAMMAELCRRSGVVLPVETIEPWPLGKPPVRVAVLCNLASASGMLSDLKEEMVDLADRVTLTEDPAELRKVDRVLVLLTAGILQQPSLQQLEEVIQIDKAAQQDRIVAMFSEAAGWKFGCDEHTCTPLEVKACIDDHEAIAYRAKDPGGPSCHEFPAMLTQLLGKLRVGSGAYTSTSEVARRVVIPVVDVQQQLAVKDAQLAAKDASLAAQAASLAAQAVELEELRARLVATTTPSEGMPPAE